ncbi:MAG TPA: EVE domain-containing protein [Candidatus Kapabacteria bacterium]|nr:EVE domain-containing protein [Candidatus Kapabacteria bacterium]
MNYWLLKTEPTSYSIDDLERDGKTDWTGVRNYAARNFLRDSMSKGDLAFFYHSSADVIGIVGIAEISSDAQPDPTAWDKKDSHFDPKSSPANPIWYSRDIKFKKKFKNPILLSDLRNVKGLDKMILLQKGSRLSVQPVTEKEWDVVTKVADSR